MATIEAVKEALWLRGFLGELGYKQDVTLVYCDSQSAIHLAKHQTYYAKTKHINISYNFIRELLKEVNLLLRRSILERTQLIC